MTHPYLVTGLPPIGTCRMGFRSPPARLFGNRKGGSVEKRFKSAIVVHTRRDVSARPSGMHPRKKQSDPADGFGGGADADLTRRTQPRSITCKEISK